MKNFLNSLDPKILSLVRLVAREADRKKVAVYLVGGCVRDLILKKKNLDVDIVCEGDAIGLAKSLKKTLQATGIFYEQFGTATLILKNGLRFDLASARQEKYPFAGALPVVTRGDLKDDLFRRDFAINAMAICLNKNRFGQMIDEFGGLNDLQGKLVRVLHDKSFEDDPTRILRAVRFEQRFRFSLEARTLNLFKKAVNNRLETKVKPPRYFAEFKKMLSEENPVSPLKRLNQFNGLRFLSARFFLDLKRVVLVQSALVKKTESESWIFYLMAVCENISEVRIGQALKAFQLSHHSIKCVLQSHSREAVSGDLAKSTISPSEVYRLLRPYEPTVVRYFQMMSTHKMVAQRIGKYLSQYAEVKVAITGNDLIRLGIRDGKMIGNSLQRVLLAKIDGKLKDFKDEIRYVQELKLIND